MAPSRFCDASLGPTQSQDCIPENRWLNDIIAFLLLTQSKLDAFLMEYSLVALGRSMNMIVLYWLQPWCKINNVIDVAYTCCPCCQPLLRHISCQTSCGNQDNQKDRKWSYGYERERSISCLTCEIQKGVFYLIIICGFFYKIHTLGKGPVLYMSLIILTVSDFIVSMCFVNGWNANKQSHKYK